MAIDLRFILAVIKINGDLSASATSRWASPAAPRRRSIWRRSISPWILRPWRVRGRMIRSAVQALLDGDAQLAESVRAMDDEIDRMNRLATLTCSS